MATAREETEDVGPTVRRVTFRRRRWRLVMEKVEIVALHATGPYLGISVALALQRRGAFPVSELVAGFCGQFLGVLLWWPVTATVRRWREQSADDPDDD